MLESLVNSLGEYCSKLLTVREVEELLSVSRQRIYRLIESGELTRVNVGTATRIPLRSVADYVNHKITEVTQEPVAAS